MSRPGRLPLRGEPWRPIGAKGAAGRLRAALLVALAFAPAPALADFFAPGQLSRSHAPLKGIRFCSRCHEAGKRVSDERCLVCHVEVRERLVEGRGLHGRLPPAERACSKCHREHLGKALPLVDWGPKGRKEFDHAARTGFQLTEVHGKQACEACHRKEQIADPKIRALLASPPRWESASSTRPAKGPRATARATFLGLSRACIACHVDPHHKLLGDDCTRCHGQQAWSPAGAFDHAKTKYPLSAAHRTLACERCHGRPPSWVGLKHERCTDCHEEPHEGRLGDQCQGCHEKERWPDVRDLSQDRDFHKKTRFPLEGAHAAVACEKCHGPGIVSFRPVPANAAGRFARPAFGRCTDCHADAHLGQLKPLAGDAEPPDCRRCHDSTSFTAPPRFDLAEHEATRFPLKDAHQAVACRRCHPEDPSLSARIGQELRRWLAAAGRPARFSLVRFEAPGRLDRCESCHADPHAGQFLDPAGCPSCHKPGSFHELAFDHDKGSRFPLEGKHKKVACAACHKVETIGGAVRYRPLPMACPDCHADPHLEQLSEPGKRAECARCHTPAGFKPALFIHEPPATTFRLVGKHRELECARCHPAVQVARGVTASRYKPVPKECAGCHEDLHHGSLGPRCEECHRPDGFRGARYDHAEKTGFALTGAHARTRCAACHSPDQPGALPRACAACHKDPHGGALGERCEECHSTDGWASRYDARAHARTAFPLNGRHGLLPCEACHGDARDQRFLRGHVDCVSCHAPAAASAARAWKGHQALGTDCGRCHAGTRFSPAAFPDHACFPLGSSPSEPSVRRPGAPASSGAGAHARLRCLDCHARLPDATSGCSSGTVSCGRCHAGAAADARHRGVAGYQRVERRCQQCHR
jgi:hypothetical protein